MTMVARVLVGLVLLAAGVLKAADPSQSVMAVGAYDLLPPWGSLMAAFLLVGVEISVGAALVTGFFARSAAALAALLSLAFLGVVASAHFRGLDIACGCFGALSPALESPRRTALLDVAMLLSSIAAWRGARQAAPPAAPR